MRIRKSYLALCWLCSATFILSACDNTIQPFTESDANFGLFGFIDTEADTQFVRVEPRRETQNIEENLARPSLISREMSTGEVQVWQDSVVTTNNGGRALLYWALFRPEKATQHVLTASGAGLVDTDATTLIPGDPILTPGDTVETTLGTWEQSLNISRVEAVVDDVFIKYTTAFPNGVLFEKEFDYFNRFLSNGESGWAVLVRLERDFDDIRIEGGFADAPIPLREVKLVIRFKSADWTGAARLQSNVSSGLGFFGSVMTYEESWTVDTSLLSDINVLDQQSD